VTDPDAIVVGAGPNGLTAANALADAGWSVLVVEAEAEPGGAVKSAELIEPGFVNDVFSAFYPLAAASPALRALELERFGLEWCHGPLVLAHPAIDGSCVALSRDLDETAASLDGFAPGDGDAWQELMALWARIEPALLRGMTTPLPPVRSGLDLLLRLGPRGLLRLARLGVLPVRRFAAERFAGEGGAQLLAGNALHADLGPESALGGFFGFFLAALGQRYGFPYPRGGAGRLSDALVRRARERGVEIVCGARVADVVVRGGRARGVQLAGGERLAARRAVLAADDAQVLPSALLGRDGELFDRDWATLKVDWTLDGPVPWSAPDARRAPVVHVGGTVDELSLYANEIHRGLAPTRPFLVFGQYACGDPTRAPAGKETAWAYTHLPQGLHPGEALATVERIEAHLERYAPGFRALVRGRHVLTPEELETANPSLVGGALNGGTAQLHQQLFLRPRPGLGRPETAVRQLYLASSSAHPGGGVHGAAGWNAARVALRGGLRRRAARAPAGASSAGSRA
jgi:phytoene dehydrogenase-like protein